MRAFLLLVALFWATTPLYAQPRFLQGRRDRAAPGRVERPRALPPVPRSQDAADRGQRLFERADAMAASATGTSQAFPVGDLDPRFGTGGQATFGVAASNDVPGALVALPDGGFAVIGSALTDRSGYGGEYDVAMARYTASGVLQKTSTSDGVAFLWGGFRAYTPQGFRLANSSEEVLAASVDASGKVLVAGYGDFYDQAYGIGADSLFVLTVAPDGTVTARTLPSIGYSNVALADAASDRVWFVQQSSSASRLTCTLATTGAPCTGFTASGTSLPNLDYQALVRARNGDLFALETDADDHAPIVLRLTADGRRASAFGINGAVELRLPGYRGGGLLGATELADGKILVVGGSYSDDSEAYFIARLTATGALDPTFGSNGYAVSPTLDGGIESAATSVTQQADGTLLVVGVAFREDPATQEDQLFLAAWRLAADGRLLTEPDLVATAEVSDLPKVLSRGDGSLLVSTAELPDAFKASIYAADFATRRVGADGRFDRAFGTGGAAVTDVGGGFQFIQNMVVEADGSVIALANGSADYSDYLNQYQAVLLKLRPDGSLDTRFGDDGRLAVTEGYPWRMAYGLVRLQDGGVFAVGTEAGSGYELCEGRKVDETGMEVWRGSYGIGASTFCYHAAAQSDGRIVVGAEANQSGFWAMSALRIAADGTRDYAFGTNGRVEVSPDGRSGVAFRVAVQPDGKVLLAGWTYSVGSGASYDATVARVLPTGALDPTFGTGGVFRFDVSGASRYDVIRALALQPDGKIVIGGDANTSATSTSYDSYVMRLTASGALDPSFGTGGIAMRSAPNSETTADLMLQRDGRVLVTGTMGATGQRSMMLYRLTAAGQPDPTFKNGDLVGTSTFGPIGPRQTLARAIAQKPDGAILLGGYAIDGYGAAHPRTDALFAQFEGDTPTPVEASAGVAGLSLSLASPHPARETSRIAYVVPVAGRVTLAVFDILGRRVATLADGVQEAGDHDAMLDAHALAPGTYVLQLESAGAMTRRPLVVAK